MEKILIKESLPSCVALIQTQADEHNVTVIDNISRKDYEVEADYSRLKQVIVNLLSNAVKYNKKNGQVTLDADVIDNQRLRIKITDTGIGLKEDDVTRLFSSFERLNVSQNVEGAGIGLVITKNLIELMEGHIGLESTPGEGSTFWVELEMPRAA